jgi:photosystem II stability/assembly factor-like uncharacterized protein
VPESRLRRLLLLFATAVLSLGEARAGEIARPEVLDRPAIITARAATSVLVTLAVAGRRLVAAGEQGIVLLSDDNGLTWRQARRVPVSVTLTAVRFASPEVGWAVGHMGVILATRDAGETWTRQLDGIEAAALMLHQARQLQQDDGDAGTTAVRAAERLVADGPDKPFFDVLIDNAQRALVIGAFGLAFATENGGETWLSVKSEFDNPGELHLYRVMRRGERTYLAGEQGLFLRAEGDERRFTRLPTPYSGTFFGVLAPTDHIVLLYGLRGTILRSEDEGGHWFAIASGAKGSLTSGAQLNDGRLLLGSMSGQLVISRDFGRSFTPLGNPVPQPITDLVQAEDGAVVVVGPRGVLRIMPPAEGTP